MEAYSILTQVSSKTGLHELLADSQNFSLFQYMNEATNKHLIPRESTYAFALSALYNGNSETPKFGPSLFTLALKNDTNSDDTIHLKDVIIGLQVLMNHNSSTVIKTGDVNEDGKIGLEEVPRPTIYVIFPLPGRLFFVIPEIRIFFPQSWKVNIRTASKI